MNVLIATGIYPPESGGPSQYSRGLAMAFRDAGISVSVIAYGSENSDTAEDGFSVTRVSRAGGPLLRYLRFCWKAFRLTKHHDILFLQGAVSEGIPATIAAGLRRKPTVLRVPGDYAWEMAQQQGDQDLLDTFLAKRHSGKIGFYERLERWVARRARRVIAPSVYLRTVVERWGIPSEKITVLLNAEQALPMHFSRQEARVAFGVEGKTVCLTVARAVPWKGVADLIAWWKDLPDSHVLIVGGDGPEYERWEHLAEALGERVRFVGRLNRESLADWFRASDVFLLNSGYEGYPHVVAEAASLGLPCYVSDQGGNPETKAVFGDLITVLPYQGKAAWVEALQRLVKTEEREKPVSRWTHQEMTSAVKGILESCL